MAQEQPGHAPDRERGTCAKSDLCHQLVALPGVVRRRAVGIAPCKLVARVRSIHAGDHPGRERDPSESEREPRADAIERAQTGRGPCGPRVWSGRDRHRTGRDRPVGAGRRGWNRRDGREFAPQARLESRQLAYARGENRLRGSTRSCSPRKIPCAVAHEGRERLIHQLRLLAVVCCGHGPPLKCYPEVEGAHADVTAGPPDAGLGLGEVSCLQQCTALCVRHGLRKARGRRCEEKSRDDQQTSIVEHRCHLL